MMVTDKSEMEVQEDTQNTSVENIAQIRPKPNQDVIERLERALEHARSGELQDVAIFGNLTGNRYYENYSSVKNAPERAGYFLSLAIQMAGFRK